MQMIKGNDAEKALPKFEKPGNKNESMSSGNPNAPKTVAQMIKTVVKSSRWLFTVILEGVISVGFLIPTNNEGFR